MGMLAGETTQKAVCAPKMIKEGEKIIMKTIQELYDEIMASQELKAQFIEAAKAGKQEEFLKAHGCEATLEEVRAFLEAKQSEDTPLSFDDLENAAGGCDTTGETIASVLSAGLMCAALAITSAAMKGFHVGQRNEHEGRICNKD